MSTAISEEGSTTPIHIPTERDESPNNNATQDAHASSPPEQAAAPAQSDYVEQPTQRTSTANARQERSGELVVVADAVVLDEGEDIPVVHVADEFDWRMETIRLDSENIVSVRQMDNESRPEFVSIVLSNNYRYFTSSPANQQGILGLSLRLVDHGQLRVSHIDPTSPFVETAMAVDDVLISINNNTCKGMDPDRALALLLSSSTASDGGHTTIRLHNVGGNAQRVATTVEKERPDTVLGVAFKTNNRGSLFISRLDPNKILASSLFNPGDRVLFVNQHDCSTIVTNADEVRGWIRNAPRFVTMVVETATMTGVVIATGDAAHAPGTTYGLPSTTTPHRPTTTNRTAQGARHNGHKFAGACVGICLIIIILGGVIATQMKKNRDDADDYHFCYFCGRTPYPTPSPWRYTPAPTPTYWGYRPTSPVDEGCEGAFPLAGDGVPVLGSTDSMSNLFRHCGTYENFPSAWYVYDAGENTTRMEVSTCHQYGFQLDTMLTVLESLQGDCASLDCLNSNDDDYTCQESISRLEFEAVAGRRYYIVVQGYGGATGIFGIKLAPVGGDVCQCIGNQIPTPAP